MNKFAATEFYTEGKQGRDWGGAAAFERAKEARKLLYNIRKQNQNLTAKQAFQQLRASANPELFKGWKNEDMNLFIDRYITNDPNQENYKNAGKLFSRKRGQLFHSRSALEDDLLLDKPLGHIRAAARNIPANFMNGMVGGITFFPELAWSGVKMLGNGLAGRGWKYETTDWNPLDERVVNPSIADYKTAGKTVQKALNSTASYTGLVLPAFIGAGVPASGTGSALQAGMKAATGKPLLQKGKKFVSGYLNQYGKNAMQIGKNTAKALKNPLEAMKSRGSQLASQFKKAPVKTALSTVGGIALGPGFVAYDVFSGPENPANDYMSSTGGQPSFMGAVDINGNPIK